MGWQQLGPGRPTSRAVPFRHLESLSAPSVRTNERIDTSVQPLLHTTRIQPANSPESEWPFIRAGIWVQPRQHPPTPQQSRLIQIAGIVKESKLGEGKSLLSPGGNGGSAGPPSSALHPT